MRINFFLMRRREIRGGSFDERGGRLNEAFSSRKKSEPKFGANCPPKVDDTRIKSSDEQFRSIS